MTASAERVEGVWGMVLLQGIISVVIGLLLLLATEASLTFIVLLVGLWWLIQGIFSLVSIFMNSEKWGWKLIIGILGIVAGFLVIGHPAAASLLLPGILAIILGIEAIVIGVLLLIMAFQGDGWGTGVLGVIAVLIGLLLLFNAWVAGIWLVVLLGLLILISGIVSIIYSFQLR